MYTHVVDAGDTVTSINGAQDIFSLSANVFTEFNVLNIAGDFDDNGVDILRLDNQIAVLDPGDNGLDFAFIDPLQLLGQREFSSIAGQDPIDIHITEASTHIEFDGNYS